MAISIVSTGALAHGTGDITAVHGTHAADDWALLIVETADDAVATPSGGWTPTLIPYVSNGASTRQTGFIRKCTSAAMGDPVITDPGDHASARIRVFRGCDLTTPVVAMAAGQTTGAATQASTTCPSIYSPVANGFYFDAASWSIDNAGPLVSTESNASLTNVVEVDDEGSTDGNGGGQASWAGDKAAAGSILPMTATFSTGSAQTHLVFIFQPPVAATGGGPIVLLDGAY